MSLLTTPQPKPVKQANHTSPYHGVHVSQERSGTVYMCRLYLGYGKVYLGRYADEKEAALIWDTAVRLIWDKPEWLNFPKYVVDQLPALTEQMRQRVISMLQTPAARKIMEHPAGHALQGALDQLAAEQSLCPEQVVLGDVDARIEEERAALNRPTPGPFPKREYHNMPPHVKAEPPRVTLDELLQETTPDGMYIMTYDHAEARKAEEVWKPLPPGPVRLTVTIEDRGAEIVPIHDPLFIRLCRWIGRLIGTVCRRFFHPFRSFK